MFVLDRSPTIYLNYILYLSNLFFVYRFSMFVLDRSPSLYLNLYLCIYLYPLCATVCTYLYMFVLDRSINVYLNPYYLCIIYYACVHA